MPFVGHFGPMPDFAPILSVSGFYLLLLVNCFTYPLKALSLIGLFHFWLDLSLLLFCPILEGSHLLQPNLPVVSSFTTLVGMRPQSLLSQLPKRFDLIGLLLSFGCISLPPGLVGRDTLTPLLLSISARHEAKRPKGGGPGLSGLDL